MNDYRRKKEDLIRELVELRREKAELRREKAELAASLREKTTQYDQAMANMNEVRHLRDWHQAIVDMLPVGVWVSDPNGQVVLVNQAAVDMYGGRSSAAGRPDEYTSYKLFRHDTGEPVSFEPYPPTGALKDVAMDFERFDGTRGTLVASTEALRDTKGNIINYVAVSTDITRLTQAEEALRETKAKVRDAGQLIEYQNRKLNAIIQSLPYALVIYDKNATPIFYNEQALIYYDKAIENKNVPLAHRVQAMRPVHKEGASAATEEMPIMRALRGEVVRNLEMSYISRSGERVWVSSTAAPIYDDDGEITEVVSTYVDITEYKRAERELQAYQRHLEEVVEERTREVEEVVRQRLDLLESISDCFYSLDRELRFTYVNTAAENAWGLSRQELTGRKIEEVFPGVIDISLGKFRQVLKEKTPKHYELYSNVTRSWVYMSVYPSREGISVFWHDLTELKNTQFQLKQSQQAMADALEFNRAILQASPLGISIYDSLGQCRFANESAARIAQGSIEHFYGNFFNVESWHRHDGMLDAIRRVMETGEEELLDVDCTPIVGTAVWLQCRLSRFNSRGEPHLLLTFEDITERRKAEEQLSQERQRLFAVLDTLNVNLYLITPDYHVAWANRAFRQCFGESEGRSCYEFICGLDAPCECCEAFVPLQTGQSHHWVFTSPNGSVFDVYDYAFIDVDGKPLILEMNIDITERKRVEAKKKAIHDLHRISTSFVNEGDLSAILGEMLDLALTVTGADMGNIQLLDDAEGVLRIIAHRGFENPFLEFFAAVDHGTGSCGAALGRGERVIVADVTKSPIFVGTAGLNVLLEAGVRAVQSTPLITRTGEVLGMLNTHYRTPNATEKMDYQLLDLLARQVAEVIDHKKAQDALRQSEGRFAKIFYNSPVIISMIDMRTKRFTDINWRFTEVLGYARGEVIGRTPSELNLIVDKNHLKKRHRHLINDGAILNDELTFRTRSGRLMKGLYSTEIIDVNGKKHALTVIKDVTKERMMEAEMARLDRLNLIGEMAASIGHEIRNPMTAVRGFLQMLGSKPEYRSDSTYFELMIEELDRANSIITEYLGMAKDKIVDLQANSLDGIITALHPILMSDANLREMIVRMELSNPPRIRVDEREIRQLIMNMARNGMEAMSGGGMLTIGTRLEDKGVVLYIKDEGHGLDPVLIEKLGTPFLTTKENGTGLGLAVCYSIAARHHARIDCETGPGGTTFYVRFPLPEQERGYAAG